MRIAVLMPAFNEEGRLARTLEELTSAAAAAEASAKIRITIFLVDDGSSPPIDERSVHAAVALGSGASNAAHARVVIARHAVNLGQGAALETARRLALEPRWQPAGRAFDAFVTMDSDGQHRGADVLALAAAIAAGADVALGDRFAGGSNVPSSRRVLLGMARAFERATTGLRLSDAHNGLRAFGPRVIARMQIRQNRMAHATELTRHISRASAARGASDRLRVVEVPVSVEYTPDSLAKGQRASGAVAIVMDLLRGFLFEAKPRPDSKPRTEPRG